MLLLVAIKYDTFCFYDTCGFSNAVNGCKLSERFRCNLSPLKTVFCCKWFQTCKNKWYVLYERPHKLVGLILQQQPISCVYRMVPNQRDIIRVEFSQCLYLPAVTSERPIGFEEGLDPAHRAAPLLTGTEQAGLKVQGNNRVKGREAGWSIYHRNKALLPNLRAQRHREVLFTLSSFSQVRFSLSPVVLQSIDWFCVCTADHTRVIFTEIIEIEIYRRVVFLL